jgi:hypothetical protein
LPPHLLDVLDGLHPGLPLLVRLYAELALHHRGDLQPADREDVGPRLGLQQDLAALDREVIVLLLHLPVRALARQGLEPGELAIRVQDEEPLPPAGDVFTLLVQPALLHDLLLRHLNNVENKGIFRHVTGLNCPTRSDVPINNPC